MTNFSWKTRVIIGGETLMSLQTPVRLKIPDFLLILFPVLFFGPQVFAQPEKPKSRDIVPVFETTRPPAQISSEPKSGPARPNRPSYKRVSSRRNSGKIKSADRPGKNSNPQNQTDIAENRARQIGITLWKLNEVRSNARFETFLETSGGRKRYLQPERVSINTIFRPFDRVRFSVESSRRGYLYIIDQEMYRDGTLGDAYLVFPSKRIGSGANRVAPGRPVELPDLKGNPFYFELRPENPNGDVLTAEILTVIITDRPIPGLEIGNQPALISEKTLEGWRTKWAGRAEIFEAAGDKAAYTRREREAAGGEATLTGEDPLPETVFLVEANRNGGSLITVPLWYGGR
jgi:hypothetical protein